MIKTELCLFQMQIESEFRHALKLSQAVLGVSPKNSQSRWYANDHSQTHRRHSSFVSASHTPHRPGHRKQANHPNEWCSGCRLCHELPLKACVFVHPTQSACKLFASFEYVKDDGLVTRTAATLATHTFWTEVGFVDFYFPRKGFWSSQNSASRMRIFR